MESVLSPAPSSGGGGPQFMVFSASMQPSVPRKRRRLSSDALGSDGSQPTKQKVSRACDFCKSRKAKCSGTQPCTKCEAKGEACRYESKYTRGRPPTPPPSTSLWQSPSHGALRHLTGGDAVDLDSELPTQPDAAPSRASPELGMAEIQGQMLDPTSSLTFLHRAWKKLSAQGTQTLPGFARNAAEHQPLTMAGDSPLPDVDETPSFRLLSSAENRTLVNLYFDVCIATYRFLHRPSVDKWLHIVERNLEENRPVWHEVGRPKAAIVLVVLAVAITHQEKSNKTVSVTHSSGFPDLLFGVASRLTDNETGYPKLESAQARLVQVLYLLTTSRFNKSWYVFGTTLQIISTIGLHLRAHSKRMQVPMDYVQSQYRMRTFWTAYILDNYLGVVFGRPRHFHDDDIDQEYPDRVHDEEITPMGPLESHQDATRNCHIDALIFHAKIAKIIGSISREVYTTKKTSYQERIDAAHRHIQQIHEWRSSLPLYLGSIDPSMLIPSYRRQAIVLKLAKNHAIIHASRLFILSNRTSSVAQESYVEDCMSAAKTVLETVDQLAKDGPIFHAFWWTHYVTFCSLIVVYVFQMQQRRLGQLIDERNNSREKLLELAEACQTHLALATASNSPSRRYAVILEEFRAAAMSQQRRSDHDHRPREVVASMGCDENEANQGAQPPVAYGVGSERSGDQTPLLDSDLLDAWQTTDWLELDSSAFWPHLDPDGVIAWSQ